MLEKSRPYMKMLLALMALLLLSGRLVAQSDPAPLLVDLDIPLMPGFVEVEGDRVVFDTPEGRIVEARATGPHGRDRAVEYYKLVLPSLSWAAIPEQPDACKDQAMVCLVAQRDGEILTLKISKIKTAKGGTLILFSVSPE
ncbi:MAG: hypothetical protein COB54_05325 [Alphaproteobacteria bacterium]|nr:MAG: hypothetical protein COB54_05325 [Alphaproteobacteria bacterium]